MTDIKTMLKKILLTPALIAICFISFAQSNCDTTLVNAYLHPAGYTRLYVPGQPCSMYYYNPTPMYGINAHQSSLSLGIPQLIINNAVEDSEVSAALYAQGVYSINPEVWMGLTDSATNYGNAPYSWRTFAGDTNITYFDWDAGEPNNAAPSCRVGNSCAFCFGDDAYWCQWGEDCLVLQANGKWNDITCLGDGVTHIAVLEVNTCPVMVSAPPDTTICAGTGIRVSATDSGATAPVTYTWNPGNLTGQTVTLSPPAPDTFTVVASDRFHCIVSASFNVTINANAAVANAGPDIQLCPGASDSLGGPGIAGNTYLWSPAWGLSSSTAPDPTISFSSNPTSGTLDTMYILTATSGGCSKRDTVHVTLYPDINNQFTAATGVCMNDGLLVTYAGTPSGTATYNWNFDSATVISGSGAGAYVISWPAAGVDTIALSVTDHGCSASAVSQAVTVYPKPYVTISKIGNDSLETNTTYTSYQWLLNGVPVPGDTLQSATATANGVYQVVVTDAFGCTDTSARDTVTGVGIHEISSSGQVLLYPNPSNGSFIVETRHAAGGEISISDVLGRVIASQTIMMDKQPLELQTIASGEYYVTVKFNGQVYNGKVVVTRE